MAMITASATLPSLRPPAVRAERRLRPGDAQPGAGLLHGHNIPLRLGDRRRQGRADRVRAGAARRRRRRRREGEEGVLLQLVLRGGQRGHAYGGDAAGLGGGQGELGARVRPVRVVRRGRRRRPRRDGAHVPDPAPGGAGEQPVEERAPSACCGILSQGKIDFAGRSN
ncbi:Os12g0240825 [Oryza sativa Japonica Group]|uniref:Os12g0240825 protein n=1 Tax=Oryza sativa subsp. japonica TaxID=39947 RepID=C7J9R7_ORYSJ|nr:Os12g0240825 [Oryza sativa Japonica Group]|eukprot:NP_001176866.1 Os12g0240825 [Oryza sativa Japonica Group]